MASTKEEPIINTSVGKIRGSLNRSREGDDFFSFKGIPYAKPPVGTLRFKDPVPIQPWSGVKDAKNFGSPCAQIALITKTYKGSEDCLYLNVYTKNLRSSKKLPVMVWIHGGAFMCGDSDDGSHGPDYFLRKDIVFVTINYRLGIFGFLNLEDEISPGNYGLKDQVLALKWVRDNISNFGGDPDNVTISGNSSGSASVHYLTMSPLSKGLYHKAIMESGVALNPWASLENPTKYVYRMCDILGNNTRDHKKIFDFLRSIDCKKLVETQDETVPKEERLKIVPFGPGIDAKSRNPFMPIHPEEAAKRGVRVPLLIGYNSRESLMFVNHKMAAEKLDKNFINQLHPKTIKYIENNFNLSLEDLKLVYVKDGQITEDNREKLTDLLSDMDFVLGIHQVLKIQVEEGLAETYMYKYTFDKIQSPLKTKLGINSPGACHTDEMKHLFRSRKFDALGMEPLKKGSVDYKMMEKMIEMWVNFATTGRPTSKPTELVPLYWQPVNNERILRYLNIDEELKMEFTLNLEEHLLAQKQLHCTKLFLRTNFSFR